MAQIVAIFRETCVEEVATMAVSIADHDPVGLSRAAHGLMGCLGMFGSRETIALAASLEEAGRSGQLAGTDKSLAKLKDAIRGMQSTLDKLAGVFSPGGFPVGMPHDSGSV